MTWKRALLLALLCALLGAGLTTSAASTDDLNLPQELPDGSKLVSVKDVFTEVADAATAEQLRANMPHVLGGTEYRYAADGRGVTTSDWGVVVFTFEDEGSALRDYLLLVENAAAVSKGRSSASIPSAQGTAVSRLLQESDLDQVCVVGDVVVFPAGAQLVWVDDYRSTPADSAGVRGIEDSAASVRQELAIAEALVGMLGGAAQEAPSRTGSTSSCQLWFRIRAGSSTYALYTIGPPSQRSVEGKRLGLPGYDDIEGIYAEDPSGSVVGDAALLGHLIVVAQSAAALTNEISDDILARPIHPMDAELDLRSASDGDHYWACAPTCTALWWRDMWIYRGSLTYGLNEENHRADIWADVILDSVLQPALTTELEDDRSLIEELEALHTALVLAKRSATVSSIILQGKSVFGLTLREIQTTLESYSKIAQKNAVINSLGWLSVAMGAAALEARLSADTAQLLFLRSIADARATERLEALARYASRNSAELDPAFLEGLQRADERLRRIRTEYYDAVHAFFGSLTYDTALDVGFLLGGLARLLGPKALGRLLLPYSLSWEVYKWLRDVNYEVQRCVLAATLQRYLAGHTPIGSLAEWRQEMADSAAKDSDQVLAAANLYNVSSYVGYYFYAKLRQILSSSVYAAVGGFLRVGNVADYLSSLEESARADAEVVLKTRSPEYITGGPWGGAECYRWLLERATACGVSVQGAAEQDVYERGDTARMHITLTNALCSEQFLCPAVELRSATGETFSPDAITPECAQVRPSGGAAAFIMEWQIPETAPEGAYEYRVVPGSKVPTAAGSNATSNWEPAFRVTSGQTPAGGLGSATVLVIDVSGSMAWQDPTGVTKMDAAKTAAQAFINMLADENRVTGSSHQLGIVTFTNTASRALELTTDTGKAQSVVSGLKAQLGTNMAQGLSMANDMLSAADPKSKRIIVLLTDGVPTVSNGKAAGGSLKDLQMEVLLGPVAAAALSGTCIFTVGFGKPGDIVNGDLSIDPTFLSSVALATSCGKYYAALNADDLRGVYIELRHGSLGTVRASSTGTVKQGETVTVGTVDVPANQKELHFTLDWRGSRLDPILIDPTGARVASGYPGADISVYPDMAHVTVLNPAAGKWELRAYGAEVPEGTLTYHAVLSTRGEEASGVLELLGRIGAFLLALLLVALAAALGIP